MKQGSILIAVIMLLAACQPKSGENLSWQKVDKQHFEYAVIAEVASSKIEYGDKILFHYQLFNGDSLIESSWNNETAIELILPDKMHRNQFMEPLTLVGQGDSLWVRIPYEDAQDELSSFEGNFKAGDVAIFKYKILEVETRLSREKEKQTAFAKAKGFASRTEMLAEQKAIQASADQRLKALQGYRKAYKENKLELEQAPQGLRYYPIKSNASAPKIKKGDQVYFYYQILLEEDGKLLDNQFERGERTLVTIGAEDQYIPAFQLALSQMKMGESACFFVPSALAYGEEGIDPLIPAAANLVLDIEIVALRADSSKAID